MEEDNKETKPVKFYFYLSVAASVIGAVMLGLTFTPIGIYGLISSILLGIAAISFARTQKKKNNFKGVLAAEICAYVLLGLAAAFFIGGIIYSAV